MIKKKFGLIFCFILLLSSIFTVFAADLEILPEDYRDAPEGMIQGAEFGEYGTELYPDGRMQFMMGSWIRINDVDLSLYSSIEITYGARDDLISEDETGNPAYFALSTVNNLTDAEPIAKVDIEVPEIAWVPDNIVVMNLNSGYKGDVYFLSNLFDLGDDVDSDKANVVLIDFVEKADPNATNTPQPTPTPVVTAKSTTSTITVTPIAGTVNKSFPVYIIIIAIVVALVIIAAVVVVIVLVTISKNKKNK